MPSSLPPELCGYFRTHFVTALSNTRTDGRVEIFRTRSESPGHGLDCLNRDPRRRAAPAGMYGGYRMVTFVYQQNRDAVGGFHRDHATGLILEKGISFTQHAAASIGSYTRRGVNLF